MNWNKLIGVVGLSVIIIVVMMISFKSDSIMLAGAGGMLPLVIAAILVVAFFKSMVTGEVTIQKAKNELLKYFSN